MPKHSENIVEVSTFGSQIQIFDVEIGKVHDRVLYLCIYHKVDVISKEGFTCVPMLTESDFLGF
jgi:hypothetical protein